jgi:hypothetical protein
VTALTVRATRCTRIATALRLALLHLASRRVPACLLAFAACAVALRMALHWTPAAGPFARQIPLIIESAAAAVIGVTTRSPFGDAESATGRWLPLLRFGTVITLTCAAFGALAAGSVGGHLVAGSLGLLRNIGGITGIVLLTAALIGGGLSWTGALTFLIIAGYAGASGWTTPWVWPARPPHDVGAAICAALAIAAGTAVITVRGARDTPTE